MAMGERKCADSEHPKYWHSLRGLDKAEKKEKEIIYCPQYGFQVNINAENNLTL